MRYFAWQFQVRRHMMPVFLVKTSGKISLWCFKLASWRRKNFKLCDVFGTVLSPQVGFWGLSPPTWNIKQYWSVDFYQNSECQVPRTNVTLPPCKLSGDGSGLECFVSKCRITCEGFIDLALRVFVPLQQVPSWLLTATSQQQTAARLS